MTNEQICGEERRGKERKPANDSKSDSLRSGGLVRVVEGGATRWSSIEGVGAGSVVVDHGGRSGVGAHAE